jgi:acetoin utilization deacetylase AcuC-like enzyme
MLGFISHPACRDHDAGPMHPDTAERLDAINNQLLMSGLDYVLRHFDAPEATRAQLARAHDPAYVARICDSAPGPGESVEIDGDTVMSPGTLTAALHAAGAGVMGVDMVMRGEANPVFCAVRPPGHHATRDAAMGFCLFNNIAVAAAHALAEHGLTRIAVLDFDVHHGNGTEEIFHSDARILFCSAFQHPFYPFTGHESDSANLVDVPLPAGTGGDAFREAIRAHWLPALERFAPEMLFISAGFDAHLLDDMSGLGLTEDDYRWLTTELSGVAQRHAQGRILSMLEGGYEPGALARSVVAHVNALMG